MSPRQALTEFLQLCAREYFLARSGRQRTQQVSKTVENKIAQSQKQSAKLATTKHGMNASYREDAYAEQRKEVVAPMQCPLLKLSLTVDRDEEPRKSQPVLQGENRGKTATLHTRNEQSPASMECGIHSSPT